MPGLHILNLPIKYPAFLFSLLYFLLQVKYLLRFIILLTSFYLLNLGLQFFVDVLKHMNLFSEVFILSLEVVHIHLQRVILFYFLLSFYF